MREQSEREGKNNCICRKDELIFGPCHIIQLSLRTPNCLYLFDDSKIMYENFCTVSVPLLSVVYLFLLIDEAQGMF